MKFNHLILVIVLLLTIEIYNVICKPYTGSQIKKGVETKHVKANVKNVKNTNTKNAQNTNVQSKIKTQAKAQAKAQAQVESNQKKSSSKNAKNNNTNKTVAPVNSRITSLTSNTKPNASNASTTTPTADPVFDASITNRCAQYCSTIYDKCQYFNSPSLSEYTLDNIYPPPNNSFGQCLCKGNNSSLYLECSLCLLATSGSPDLNSADQIIKSKCQAIEQTQSQITNSPVTSNLNVGTNNNISDMKNSTDAKNVNNMTPISLASEKKNNNKSFNPRNLIIICGIVGGVLSVYGGYKLKEHIKDQRRKTLPPRY